jgi:hypothetical protein
MMRKSFIWLFACAGLLFGSYASPRSATVIDVDDCFQQVKDDVQPSAWETIKRYFVSLSLQSKASKSRSLLMQLRATIVDYESAKQQLIEIIEAHLKSQMSGGVSERLQLSIIPELMDRIERITVELKHFGDEQELFAAEKPFKDLVLQMRHRGFTLCRLTREAKSGFSDPVQTQEILQELKLEAAAISKADDALGDYIKATNK